MLTVKKLSGANRLAQNLRALRKAAGLKRVEFAKKLDLKVTTVANYENGAEPRLDTLIEMADLLGVSIDELVGHGENLEREKPGKNLLQKKIILQIERIESELAELKKILED